MIAAPSARPIVIRGARILPLAGDDALLEGCDLWIADGLIHSILPAGSPSPVGAEFEELRFTNAVVIPGLTNAHTHSSSAMLRGQIPGDHLDLFLLEGMARHNTRGPREVRIVALYHAIEMIKSGVTGCIDHIRQGMLPDTEAMLTLMGAYEEAGMRAAVAPMFEDLKYIESLPIDASRLPDAYRARWEGPPPPDAAEYFSALEEIVVAWHGTGLAHLMLGVEGPQRCSTRLLEMTGDFAARYNVGLHTHLLESKTQALMGEGMVRVLDRFGLVNPRSSFAHFVWASDDDIELAAERGVNVVHNPVSNLALGSGLLPASRLLAAGVSVALGNDGSSANGVSILEQAKFAALLSRISNPDPESWIMPLAALRMATNGGARVLDLGPNAGSIVPGAPADLAVVDLDRAAHRPLGDVPTHLVMYENGTGVDTVIVRGEIVMRRRELTRIDEAAIYAEAEEIAREERVLNRSVHVRATQERPAYRDLIVEAIGRDIGFNRYAELD